MNVCKIRSWNAVRAELFDIKLTPVQKIILLRSRPHVHNEFQFSSRYNNISFSATRADGSNCARYAHIQYSHAAERWDTVEFLLTDEEEDRAKVRADELEGTPYDLIGQLCHATKLKLWKPSSKKIWCTKATAELMYAAKPKFRTFIDSFDLIDELLPDQLDMLARYWVRIP